RAGGVWILAGANDFNARFDRCIIRNNDSPWGSAMGTYQLELTEYILPVGATVSIENSLIEGNTSSAAIVLDSFPGFRLINSTIAHNHGGIQVSDSSGVQLQNTILYNPGYAEYQALSNDVTFTSNGGNLIGDLSLNGQLLPSDKENLDPVFVGGGDYHLGAGSPGLNKGVDLGNLSALDLGGHTRVVGSAVDIGAYEDQTVAVQELMAENLMVSPNPADAFLTIQLPEEITGPFVIEVYSPEGKRLRSQSLIPGQQLDVQGLVPATYALKVLWNERVYAGKFVKQ
ncbi:MAG: T9SS type A sorting domain-containing protein, partial [Saprospiraceae bacterium]|nr:T9SS type A sorting domain-containing protein [Saprospiraceae bacterium]